MILSKVLLAGDDVGHGLGDCYGRFFDLTFFMKETVCEEYPDGMTFQDYRDFKEENQTSDWSIPVLSEKQIRYSAEDSYFPFFLLDKQFEWLDEFRNRYESPNRPKERIHSIVSLELKAVPMVSHSELRGVPFDTHYHTTVVVPELLKRKEEALENAGLTRIVKKKYSNRWCILKTREEKDIRTKQRVVWEEDVEEKINIGSPQQLKVALNKLLVKELGPGPLNVKVKKKKDGEVTEEVFKWWINSTKEDFLKEIYYKQYKNLSEHARQTLQWIMQYKKATHLLNNFGMKLVKMCTDRGFIHPNCHQVGSGDDAIVSGRMAYGDPNLQQMPSRGDICKFSKYGPLNVVKLFRSSFAAKPGWVLVDADYSQIEPRIAAEVCNEKNLMRKFQDEAKGLCKADIHAIVAKALMSLEEEPVKGSYERDYIGKTAGLSLLYGKYWTTLKEFMFYKTDGEVDWTDEQAEYAYNNFFNEFPAFKEAMYSWSRQSKQKAEEYGQSIAFAKRSLDLIGKAPYAPLRKTVSGRPRRFTLKSHHMELPDECLSRDHKVCGACVKRNRKGEAEYSERKNWNICKERLRAASVEGFNHLIQGTAADILKLAAVKVHYALIDAGFPMDEGIIGLIHDEILLHVREERGELAKTILIRCMIEAGSEILSKVPVKVDCKIVKNWAEAK